MPIARARRVATEIARGLAKAHKAHIVHRDLKPDNVMLTADGAVKILDFGLAKSVADLAPAEEVSALTAADGVVGTPGYMSPEQARGQPVPDDTDLIASGVLDSLNLTSTTGGNSSCAKSARTREMLPLTEQRGFHRGRHLQDNSQGILEDLRIS